MKTERKEIILKSHEFGHFGINATVDRIQKHYWWKSMQKDVQYVLDRCLVCIRNTTLKPFDAADKVIEVGNLVDLIQIDLVGGF